MRMMLVSLCSTVLSQQMMIMEMFIITLVNRLLYHRPYDAVPPEEHDKLQEHNANALLQAAVEEHDV